MKIGPFKKMAVGFWPAATAVTQLPGPSGRLSGAPHDLCFSAAPVEGAWRDQVWGGRDERGVGRQPQKIAPAGPTFLGRLLWRLASKGFWWGCGGDKARRKKAGNALKEKRTTK